jgi:hypothetical protein
MILFHGRPQFEALTAAELAERKVLGPLFRLLVDFRVTLDEFDFTIPAGFETDWASIPPLARFYLDGDDPRILIPALVHDWLYSLNGVYDPYEWTLNRQQCDDVLRRLMIFCGASEIRARIVYLAVRIGGGSYWTIKSLPLAA